MARRPLKVASTGAAGGGESRDNPLLESTGAVGGRESRGNLLLESTAFWCLIAAFRIRLDLLSVGGIGRPVRSVLVTDALARVLVLVRFPVDERPGAGSRVARFRRAILSAKLLCSLANRY